MAEENKTYFVENAGFVYSNNEEFIMMHNVRFYVKGNVIPLLIEENPNLKFIIKWGKKSKFKSNSTGFTYFTCKDADNICIVFLGRGDVYISPEEAWW